MSRVLLGVAVAAILLGGCSQRYVEFTVRNDGGASVRTLELDYPGGSFGKTSLESGQIFRYRFKSLHDGKLKLSWSDARGQMHTSDGPPWKEAQSGEVEADISGADVRWSVRVQ